MFCKNFLALVSVAVSAQIVHCIHHYGDIFGRRVLHHTMSEIENMTVARAEALQYFVHFLDDDVGRREQHRGIEIPLQRDFVAHTFTGKADVGAPVQTNGIATGSGNAFQIFSSALGENNVGYSGACVFAQQAAQY